MKKTLTTPVEIDTELASLMAAQQKPQRTVDMHLEYLSTKGAEGFLKDKSHYYDEDEHKAAQAQVDAFQVKIDALTEKYTGWPRYYHVTNVNGHVHTSTSCSSCFYDTQFAWRTDLSGLSVEQVVAQEAYNACSVCMPIAPAEQKAARKAYNAEQKRQREAERQAKKDEKLAKAAVRAQKLCAKVEAEIAKMTNGGGMAEFVEQFGEYHHEGRRSTYDWCRRNNVQSTVEDVLLDIQREAKGERRWNKDPFALVAEAKQKGLID